jgi:ABC-type transport system involved in multi-copper enzyme maturation permease subunit
MRPLVADLGLSLWRLLPANPIVVRVVKVGGKRVQHLWTRAAYLLILLLVMLASSQWYSPSGSLSERAKSSTVVFANVSMLQLAMMCLLAPVFAAGAISQEKDAETFNVLLTTPLTNAQIVLGSLASRMFFVITLLLSGLPIFCITMLYGGVTTDQIFMSFGIAGCTAILTGAVAITISVMRVGSRGTIFGFYMGIGIFLMAGYGLGTLSWTFVPESISPATGEGMSRLAPFHPFLAQMVALHWTQPPDRALVEHYGWPFNAMYASPHTAYMGITLVLSVLLIGFATIFVRRGIKQGEVSVWARAWRRLIRRTSRDSRRAHRVWSNPVAWREAATRSGAASSDLVRYTYIGGGIAAAILLLIARQASWGFTTTAEATAWLSAVVLIEFATVMLMATNTAATAITRERESGTMELLLSTPLTSRYIVWGKLRGLVSFTVPLLAVPVATVLAAAIFELARGANPPMVHLASALFLPPLLLVYSAFACMLGLTMSLKSKGSVQAVVTSVGLLVAVGFGLGLCGWAVFTSGGPIAAVVSPLTFVASVWMVLNPDADAALGAGAVETFIQLFIGTVIAVTVFGMIVAGMYRSMVTNFDMIVRKQSR